MKRLSKEDARSFIIGATLGDGCLYGKKNKYFSGGHAENQLNYLNWKTEVITNNFNVKATIKLNESLLKRNPNSQPFYQMWTTSHHKLTSIYKRMYNSEGKKEINDWVLNNLNELGLAVLFMDDGCRETELSDKGVRYLRSYKFSLNSFSFEEATKFSEWLFKKYDIKSKVYLERKKHPIVKITTSENREKFKNLVSPYIHDELMYKLYI